MMSQRSPVIERLVRLWWVRLPYRASGVSRKMPHTFLDGFYLTAWPAAAAWAPALALTAGLAIGWWHPGFKEVFSESLAVLLLAAVIGTSSANLGLLFLAGFAFGDFFLAHTSWTQVSWRRNAGFFPHAFKVRIPLLIEYGLLYILMVQIPMVAKALTVQMRISSLPLRTSIRLAGVLYVLLTGVLVYFWTQSVPVLIRPVFTWISKNPPAAATVPLQKYEWAVVIAAGITAAVRMLIQGRTAFRKETGKPLDELEKELKDLTPLSSLGERTNPWVLAGCAAVWSVLMLAGIYKAWIDPVLLGALLLVLLAVRRQLIPVPLGPWPRWMDRIPLLLRLIIGFVLIRIVSSAYLDAIMRKTDTFRPLLLMTGLSMIILFLLIPRIPQSQQKKGESAS